jgi:hypothetical protein
MSRLRSTQLRQVALFAIAVLVALGMVNPAFAPRLRIPESFQPAATVSAVDAPAAVAGSVVAHLQAVPDSWRSHRPHMRIARPGRVDSALPRLFLPILPAALTVGLIVAAGLFLLGQVTSPRRRMRPGWPSALPAVRGPPAPVVA